VGGITLQFVQYQSRHTLQIFIDVAVPESDNSKATRREICVALCIATFVRQMRMLAAVDLDSKLWVVANEIDDVSA
jgi:hypothetical protein